jgi:hypothetical protein
LSAASSFEATARHQRSQTASADHDPTKAANIIIVRSPGRDGGTDE